MLGTALAIAVLLAGPGSAAPLQPVRPEAPPPWVSLTVYERKLEHVLYAATRPARLGRILDVGDGVTRNPREARRWYRIAALDVVPRSDGKAAWIAELAEDIGEDRLPPDLWRAVGEASRLNRQTAGPSYWVAVRYARDPARPLTPSDLALSIHDASHAKASALLARTAFADAARRGMAPNHVVLSIGAILRAGEPYMARLVSRLLYKSTDFGGHPDVAVAAALIARDAGLDPTDLAPRILRRVPPGAVDTIREAVDGPLRPAVLHIMPARIAGLGPAMLPAGW